MTVLEAKNMIKNIRLQYATNPQHWLDLGCGSGTFTLALAEILPSKSSITAIDINRQKLPKVFGSQVAINFVKGDMENLSNFKDFDGALMANSLHYIKNQEIFISSLIKKIKLNCNLLIVEYDTEEANQWVPFPVSFKKLQELFRSYASEINLLNQRKSIYNNAVMYAAQINLTK